MGKTKEQKMIEEIKDKFYDWKRQYDSLLKIPNDRKMQDRKRRELVSEVQLIKNEEGELILSGGARILLFLVLSTRKGWKPYLEKLKKEKSKYNYLEVLQYRHRESYLESTY